MNFTSFLRRGRIVFAVIGLLCVASAGAIVWRSVAERRNLADESRRKYNARLRDGVGTEVTFAKQGDNENNCRASANSLAHFMLKRSGTKLSGQTKSRLARMEASTLAGTSRRITTDELSEILAATAIQRISTLTDADIDHAAEVLRGFDAPDLPESLRRGRNTIKLRASKAGALKPEQFIAQVKSIRGADVASRSVFQGAAKHAIGNEVQKRSRSLSEAIPEEFGAASNGLTPMQAILLTYSVASDDLLTDSEANLQKHMKWVQEGLTRIIGQPHANPDGHLAYGINGYLFSTPLDLVFDDQTVNLLLDHIERSATQ